MSEEESEESFEEMVDSLLRESKPWACDKSHEQIIEFVQAEMRIAYESLKSVSKYLSVLLSSKEARGFGATKGPDIRYMTTRHITKPPLFWLAFDEMLKIIMSIDSFEMEDELIRAQMTFGEDYEGKKKIAHQINEHIKQYNASIVHPETARPCVIYAIASYDKAGRYTLEDRVTGKRSGSYKSILDILPIKLEANYAEPLKTTERGKENKE